MTNILLSTVNQFGHFSRIAIQNESKYMIDFTIQYSKMFPTLGRNLNMALQNENSEARTNVSNKFTTVFQRIHQHKGIRKKEIASIIDHINSAYVITDYQVLVLLKWCNKAMDCLPSDKVKLGEYLWSTLNACNISLNVTHYNAFLKLYLQNEGDFSPLKLLLDMTNNKIYPDDLTYQMCLEYYCMKGNVNMALMLLKDMKRMQISVLKSVFNLLLIAYSKSGNIKGIFAVLESMKLKKMKLTAEAYTAIMCTHAKLSNINEIEKIIKTCNLENIHFTNDHILNVIYMIAANYNYSEKDYATLIKMMYQYLTKKSNVSNDELRFLLKLVALNKIDVVASVLFYTGLVNNISEFKSIMRLVLKQTVNKNMIIDEVVKQCSSFNCGRKFKMLMLMSLHCALLKSNHVSLLLLRECKRLCTIRPHYFWPLLVRQAHKYDLQGILDVIKIMITDFNIPPCIDTIADYVLPFAFGNISYVRNLLMKYGINESVINNAYVLLMLKKFMIKEAAIYIRNFPGNYFYKVIAHDLRYTSVYKNDVQNFVYISHNLIENMDLDVTFNLSSESVEAKFVPVDKQLYDLMIDFPAHKMWLKKVLDQLELKGINLKPQTMQTIHTFLEECTTDNAIYSSN
ncbi:Leucine-rich PPR motif-containing protein, mitochondrial [Anthophora quadrimaculata]